MLGSDPVTAAGFPPVPFQVFFGHPLLVFFENGESTVIVPLEFSVIFVGPVYRQPPLPAATSAFMAELLGGIVNGVAYAGSPAFATTGALPEQPEFPRQRGEVFQLDVVFPLKWGVPQIMIASLECTGPLRLSAVMKLIGTH